MLLHRLDPLCRNLLIHRLPRPSTRTVANSATPDMRGLGPPHVQESGSRPTCGNAPAQGATEACKPPVARRLSMTAYP
jgi:hypothetical protein